MKNAPTEGLENNLRKKRRKNPELFEFNQLISKMYQCFSGKSQNLIVSVSDCNKLEILAQKPLLLEQSFKMMPGKLLNTLLMLTSSTLKFNLLDQLFNNQTILPHIDLHSVYGNTREEKGKSAFAIVLNIVKNRPQTVGLIHFLFLALPYSNIMTPNLNQEHINQLIVYLSVHSQFSAALMNKLVEEKHFTDNFDRFLQVDDISFVQFIRIKQNLIFSSPKLSMYIVSQKNMIDRCVRLINVSSVMIEFLMKALYDSIDNPDLLKTLLQKIPVGALILGNAYKLPKQFKQLCKDLYEYSCKPVISTELKELIYKFIQSHQCDLEKLAKNRNKNRLANAICNGERAVIQQLVNDGLDINIVPALAIAIQSASRSLRSMSGNMLVTSFKVKEKIKIIELVLHYKADLNAKIYDLSPLASAMFYDAVYEKMFCNHFLTLNLLELVENIKDEIGNVKEIIKVDVNAEFLAIRSGEACFMRPIEYYFVDSDLTLQRDLLKQLLVQKPELKRQDEIEIFEKYFKLNSSFLTESETKTRANQIVQFKNEKITKSLQKIRKDFDVFYETVYQLSFAKIDQDGRIERQALPSEITARIYYNTFCPGYKTIRKIHSDTNKLVSDISQRQQQCHQLPRIL